MVDRIKHVMEYYEETPAGFAEKVGVNRSNLTHLFTGRNQPSLDFAKKVLTAFPEVSTEWLIMGVGKMIKDPEEMVPVKKTFVQTDLFGAVDEGENLASNAEEVTNVVSEPVLQQSSVDNPLENVKPEEEKEISQNVIQNVDTKENKPAEEPVLTAPESNIHTQALPQSGKTDSWRVEQADAEDVKAEAQAQTQVQAKPRQNSEKNVPVSEMADNVSTTPISQTANESCHIKEKKIEKIIFFYDDHSFMVYHP